MPKIYPSLNQLHIKYLEDHTTVKIYDLSGRMLAEQGFGRNDVYDLSFFPTGMYVYQVSGENGLRERGKLLCH